MIMKAAGGISYKYENNFWCIWWILKNWRYIWWIWKQVVIVLKQREIYLMSMEETTHPWVYDKYGRNYSFMSIWWRWVWKKLPIHECMMRMEETTQTWVYDKYGRNYSYLSKWWVWKKLLIHESAVWWVWKRLTIHENSIWWVWKKL